MSKPRAIHLEAQRIRLGLWQSACGQPTPASRCTDDPRYVTCDHCQRRALREAS
jgi:hypothetical protein